MLMSKLIVKERYAVIPNKVVNNQDISLKAKGLFAFIQSKPDNWQFSAERIAYQCKEGVDSVKAGLRELEDAGFLRRIKYQNEKGQWEWEYILLENQLVEKPSVENPPTENTPNISKQDVVNNNSKQEESIMEGFCNFWKKYPRKVGKSNAEKAWKKLKPDLAVVLSSLEVQSQSEQWQKDNGRFIPHPTTWLNGKRWEDEEVEEIKTIIL